MVASDDSGSAPGSLVGVRVIDLTANVAGPFATQVLADLGADVIKVERPGGDDCRAWGPPFWPDGGQSIAFTALNRNKRSITLDLSSQTERARLDQLISTADVLIQSMRPGSFERFGYAWEALHRSSPALVYCELTGFGDRGPRQSQPAYDPLIQAYSGLMSVTGEPGRPPVRIPVSVLDQGTGMWAAIAVLDALRSRDRTGVGTKINVSLLETALAWEPFQLLGYLADGRPPRRHGSGAVNIAPYEAFPTADGFIVIAAGNQRLWERLCDVIRRPDLLEDDRFASNARRIENRVELANAIARALESAPTSEWVVRLEAAGIPASPINEVDEVLADEQVRALDMIAAIGPEFQRSAVVTTPITLDGRRYAIRRPPPTLGQHTDEVLGELAARPPGSEVDYIAPDGRQRLNPGSNCNDEGEC